MHVLSLYCVCLLLMSLLCLSFQLYFVPTLFVVSFFLFFVCYYLLHIFGTVLPLRSLKFHFVLSYPGLEMTGGHKFKFPERLGKEMRNSSPSSLNIYCPILYWNVIQYNLHITFTGTGDWFY